MAAGDTYAYDPATDYEQGRRIWLDTAAGQCWLVSAGDQVLGSYRVGPNRAGPGAHVGTASYMVAARSRGTGVGRAMVLHSLAQARAAGFRGVQFNAVAASNVHAVRLYEELGFQVVGAVPGGFCHPQQGFVDLLIMYCSLLPAGHSS